MSGLATNQWLSWNHLMSEYGSRVWLYGSRSLFGSRSGGGQAGSRAGRGPHLSDYKLCGTRSYYRQSNESLASGASSSLNAGLSPGNDFCKTWGGRTRTGLFVVFSLCTSRVTNVSFLILRWHLHSSFSGTSQAEPLLFGSGIYSNWTFPLLRTQTNSG